MRPLHTCSIGNERPRLAVRKQPFPRFGVLPAGDTGYLGKTMLVTSCVSFAALWSVQKYGVLGAPHSPESVPPRHHSPFTAAVQPLDAKHNHVHPMQSTGTDLGHTCNEDQPLPRLLASRPSLNDPWCGSLLNGSTGSACRPDGGVAGHQVPHPGPGAVRQPAPVRVQLATAGREAQA